MTTESTYDANIRAMQDRAWDYWRRIQFGKLMIAKRKAQGLPTAELERVVTDLHVTDLHVKLGLVRTVLSIVGEDVRPW